VRRRTRALGVAALVAGATLLAFSGRRVAEGIHGSAEPSSFWAFTVGTSYGETEPLVDERASVVRLDERSRIPDFLWGAVLGAAGVFGLGAGTLVFRRAARSG